MVFSFLDVLAGRAVNLLIGRHIPGLGLVITVVVVLIAGFLTTNYVGRFFLNLWDEIMYHIPLVNSVYRTVKQVVEAVWKNDDKKAFKQLVLIEYPRRGIYSLGYLTGPAVAEVSMRTNTDLVNVFVPTSPNPTSGFLLLVPREEVIPLDMSLEEGIKLIISAGVVNPGINQTVRTGYSWNELMKGFSRENKKRKEMDTN